MVLADTSSTPCGADTCTPRTGQLVSAAQDSTVLAAASTCRRLCSSMAQSRRKQPAGRKEKPAPNSGRPSTLRVEASKEFF